MLKATRFIKNKKYSEIKDRYMQKRNLNKNNGNVKFKSSRCCREKKSHGIDNGMKFTETCSLESSSSRNDSEPFNSQSVVANVIWSPHKGA